MTTPYERMVTHVVEEVESVQAFPIEHYPDVSGSVLGRRHRRHFQ